MCCSYFYKWSCITFFLLSNSLFAQNRPFIVVDKNKTQNESIGEYHAIIISINNYSDKTIPSLNKPNNDGDLLANLLNEKYDFKTENIIRIKDATRSDILDALDKKRKQIKKKDQLLIFFAGHGRWDADLKMGYWIPSDAENSSSSTWVANTDLTIRLSAISAKHILLISDACFSGAIFKTRSLDKASNPLHKLFAIKSRKALTSGNLKPVPDNSVFLHSIINWLESNNYKYQSADNLYSDIKPAILNNTQNVPLYGALAFTGDEGGEFIFHNTKSTQTVSEMDFQTIRIENKIEERSIYETDNFRDYQIQKNTKIAIIHFDNSTQKMSEYGDLGGPLRDMLTVDLMEVDNLSMVDRQSLEKVLTEQNLNNSERFDQNTSTQIGKLLGAEYIITGTYFELFNTLRIDAKLINVETGQILFSVAVDGTRNDFFRLKNELGIKIIEKLK